MKTPYLADLGDSARAECPQLSSKEWVERTLARYPHITPEELNYLRGWFAAASALDIGLVASNEGLYDAYVAFREDHLDRFTSGDLGRAFLFVVFFGGIATAVLALGMD
jgi:hypothetical protein